MTADGRPAPVTDLTAIAVTDSTITVSFTEVEDGQSEPAGYDIRAGIAPSRWWEATSNPRGECASPIAGTAIGASRTCVIHGLTASSVYDIMIVAYRGTFNVSAVFGPVSQAITHATAARGARETVTVTPSAASILTGETVQLHAEVWDTSGQLRSDRTVAWTSSDSGVARVDESGLVTGVGAGVATLIASTDRSTGRTDVTVSAPPPPPPVPGELAFQDDFESGDLTHSEHGFRWGAGVSVSLDIAHSGTHSLRFTLSGSPRQQNFHLGNDYEEIWLEWYQYWPDGIEGLGARYEHRDGPSSDNNKYLRLWADTYDPPTRFKIGSSTRPILNPDGDSYLFLEYARNGGIMDAYPPYTGWNPAISQDTRGRWVQIRHHIKVASPANNDGVFQMWVDGALVLNRTDLDVYPADGTDNYMANGYLMGSQNSGYDALTYTYIDDFKAFSVDPGW